MLETGNAAEISDDLWRLKYFIFLQSEGFYWWLGTIFFPFFFFWSRVSIFSCNIYYIVRKWVLFLCALFIVPSLSDLDLESYWRDCCIPHETLGEL